jgi:L-fucose isomerase-like protein
MVIGRKRPGFDPEWGKTMEDRAWVAASSSTAQAFRPKTRIVDDGTLREAIREFKTAECDLLLVLQPTMGDGRLAPVMAQLWDGPVVLWATPERPDGNKVSSCSLVGVHAFASLLRQLGRPFEMVYGDPESVGVQAQLGDAIRLAYAQRALRRATIGLVGSHAPGFINMDVDAVALNRDLGVQLHHFGLHEFIDSVNGQDQTAVNKDVKTVKAMGLPMEDGISDDDLAVNSRYYLAMQALMDEENLEALALRCWPELPNVIGHWPYLAMSRLAAENRVVALEGDVDGALTCLTAKYLGMGVGYISDWLEHDTETITLWHPGHALKALCVPGSLRLARHFNNEKPLVLNATLKPELPVTLLRLWRCDGAYSLAAHHARTRPVQRELLGAHGLVALEARSPVEWFDTLCHEGMPHHVILVQGHHKEALKRFAYLARISFVP